MTNLFGPINLTTTGTGANARSFTGFGFDPSDLEFSVAAKNGASALVVISDGAVDSAGSQFCNYAYYDGTNRTRNSYTDRCIYVLEHNGSTWVDLLKASFHSYITDGFKLNVITASNDYQVFVKARS